MTFTFDPAHHPENRDRFSERIMRQSTWYSVLCAPKKGRAALYENIEKRPPELARPPELV
jgi:hypothetical protein